MGRGVLEFIFQHGGLLGMDWGGGGEGGDGESNFRYFFQAGGCLGVDGGRFLYIFSHFFQKSRTLG
jgi:hypothetical protein